MSQKTAIVVLSDPQSGSPESLGRLFNALAATYDYRAAGEDVSLLFAGTGTRWPGVLQNPEHPAFELFEAVSDTVAGVSCGCADVFADSAAIERSGWELLKSNEIPGTTGLPSLRQLAAEGFTVLTF